MQLIVFAKNVQMCTYIYIYIVVLVFQLVSPVALASQK